MAASDIKFEFGSEGPKMVWRPFRPAPTIDSVKAEMRRQLRIQVETAPVAKRGIPAPDDPNLSAKQRQIRGAHIAWLAGLAKTARKRIARSEAAIARLALDITEANALRIAAAHTARLAETVSGFISRIRPLLARKIEAEADLNAFELVNNSTDQPTARSAFEFAGWTIISTAVESLISGLLFKQQMGLYSALGFALGVGVALAVIATATGIGWARLRRPEPGRKLRGIVLVALSLIAAAFVLLVVTHYRGAVLGGAADPVAAAQASLIATPFRLAFDAPLLLFVFINIAGIWLIAAKAATMFGWLDLARRRKAAERSTQRATQCFAVALDSCGASRAFAEDELQDLTARGDANVEKARAERVKCIETLDEHAEWRKGAHDSFAACEQEYRETVQSVHPAGTYQPRFDAPPEPLPEELEVLMPEIDAALHGIEGRMVKVRAAEPEFIAQLSAEADATAERIRTLYAEIERELRIGGARVHLRAVT